MYLSSGIRSIRALAKFLLYFFVFSYAGLAAERTNIVLIMADDMGIECLGSYGSAAYETPNLDRLAENGVRFEHCYSTPLCTPSRVQIMTGKYGFYNYVDFGTLPLDQVTFANLLKDSGYATCIVGKWQLGGDDKTPGHFGFDQYCVSHLGGLEEKPDEEAKGRFAHPLIQQDGRYLPGDRIRDAYGPELFCDYLLEFIDANQDRPFFAYYPMVLVHTPFVPTPDSLEWNDPLQRDVKDSRHFAEMVRYADKLVGRIVERLEKRGLLEETLILFTGDNGTHVSVSSELQNGSTIHGGKGTMLDAGTRVPLIASWKGVAARGLVSQDLVDFTDFLPSLLEAGGGLDSISEALDGRSFLPQIRGEKGDPRQWVFCHYDPNVPFGGFQLHAGRWARNQRFKLYEDGRFYDVANDPREQNDLQSFERIQGAASARKMLREVLASMPSWVEVGAHHRSSEQNKKYLRSTSGN